MADDKKPRNHTPHQEKIIKRYYSSQSSILLERLAELVGELYLSEGKKQEKAWRNAVAAASVRRSPLLC